MGMERQEFLAARKAGIGGSDIAAILGLSQWKTPYEVWLDKRGEREDDGEQSEPAYWGTVLEDVVAKEYQKRSGNKVQRVNRMMQHPEAPFALANIDRAVVNPEISGTVRWKGDRLTTDRLLECKTANGFMAKFWGDAGTDDVPDYYLTQCQWYCAITGAAACDLAVLIGGQDFRTYTIARHDDLIADLLSEGKAFWRLVQSGIAPDPQTIEDAARRWRRHVDGKVEIVGVNACSAARDLHDVKAQMKNLAEREKALKLVIMKEMGDAEAATHAGQKLCTWKYQTAERVDVKALRAEHPDIADLYTKTSESRVFRLSPMKD